MITVGTSLVLTALMLAFRWEISSLYLVDEEVLEIAVDNFLLVGAVFFVDAVTCEFKGIIAGMGYQKY